jgi:hypothetical protein
MMLGKLHPISKCDMPKKIDLKNARKISYLCLVKSPSRGLNYENPNLKDVRLATHTQSLMTLEQKQEGQKP